MRIAGPSFATEPGGDGCVIRQQATPQRAAAQPQARVVIDALVLNDSEREL